MNLIHWFLDFFLHLDVKLGDFIHQYGVWTYAILLVIIFCETGLVVTPVLPGDSLLFAAGTFAGKGDLSIALLFVLLAAAAILGDTVNYWIGKYLGPRVLRMNIVKQKHLDQTHSFFERYGGKTIILARFVPIVRTFAPFVAGLGAMTYFRFVIYNIIGGVCWVAICLFAGFYFGQLEIVQKRFSLVVIAIVFISVLPGLIEYLRHRRANGPPANPAE